MAPTTAAPVGYRRRPAPRAALRELLEATLEWAGGASAERHLRVGGTAYRLTHLADGAAGAAALLCEAPPGAGIPDYLERRRIRAIIGGVSGRHLMIFTDTAHSNLVWSWVTSGDGGIKIYRELSFRPGQAWGPLRPVLESIAAGACPPGADGPRRSASERAVAPSAHAVTAVSPKLPGARALITAISEAIQSSRRGRHLPGPGQLVQDLLEGAEETPTIREQWGALLTIRVLDRACGDGEWLEGALRVLVRAYEAVLERMRSAVDDLDRGDPAPRAERLGDMRRLVRRSGGWRDPAARQTFSTELALLHNLFGSDEGTAKVAACRARLASRLGGSTDPGLLALNVRAVEADRPGRARAAAGDRAHGSSAAGEEDVDLVIRGLGTILGMHMECEIELTELARAMTAAERRLGGFSGPLLRPGHMIERIA